LNNGSCLVIGGRWRGRKIIFDDAQGLRPTTDRIRETVFNWLQPYIHQSRCLDVFAGSGALGFEALSRGARQVTFIEQNNKTARRIEENVMNLGAREATVIHQDALRWLGTIAQQEQGHQLYDLVFLDPPFHTGQLAHSCALLASARCLAEDAVIYVEYAADENPELPEDWRCLKEKRSGQVVYKLYEYR
jgi:16S rRNA (guanine966-N2)-methyltransferase